MSPFPFQGVIFDVDGVLFDTERLARKIWACVSCEMGCPQVCDHFLEFVGQNRTDICQRMRILWGDAFPCDSLLAACSQRTQEFMEQEGVPLKPGAVGILRFLHTKGIPTGLATSTGKERTLRRMELAGLSSYFQVMVTGDQIEHSKPDPEIYRLACRELGTEPQHTLAVEDSRNGILSAHAAGMPVVMVPDLIPPTPELESLLYDRCPSLTDLQQRLEQLVP
ncbi:MAG: HAD family hydrolase [Lawsonibacter sp.]|jgi:HAD superfamily hydrolase (TIGR01509 family)